MTAAALLIGIGILGGFLAGLLGLGGSVVLAPLLLLGPAFLAVPQLSVHEVVAVSLLYLVLAVGIPLVLRHRGKVDRRSGTWLSLAAGATALIGGTLSSRLTEQRLLLFFALAVSLAAIRLMVPSRLEVPPRRNRWGWAYTGLVAMGTGLVTGGVGAAGGFLLEPSLQRFLGLPARVARATVLVIVLMSAGLGLVGKTLTGQLELARAAAVVAGALPAAWWGAELATQVRPRTLRWAALATALAASLTLWLELAPDLFRRFHPSYLYLLALVAGGLVPAWVGLRVYRGVTLRGPHLRPLGSGTRVDLAFAPIWPEELLRLVLEGPLPPVIDVREPKEAAAGRIPGAINIPFDQFEAWVAITHPADGAVIVCRNGELSQRAAATAVRQGCRVRCLTGGMSAWTGPIEP